jgi:hypothetical protein
MLMRIPGIVEAADMRPMYPSAAPRCCAKRGRTGFLDMVEEKMAHPPMILKTQNTCSFLMKI